MGFSRSVYKAAADKLYERKLEAEKNADRRRQVIYDKIPRVKELETEISLCGIKAARAVVKGGNVVEQMENLREKNLAMQKELKELLIANGYDDDVLEPQYFCKKCNDTGYYDENGKTVVCSCLKNAQIAAACDELNRTAPLSLSTFDTFNIDYYDKSKDPATGASPYKQMSSILKYCENYASDFNIHSESILMKGSTGLGKTHLSLAIANEVIKKGFGVIYASAPALISNLEKSYFSNISYESTFNMLLFCDLLIVDDLGTEFHGQFSVSQLYNLFNSRMLSGKPIIINTNLSLHEMEEIYSERFVSRICGNAKRLDFLGKDIRIRKN